MKTLRALFILALVSLLAACASHKPSASTPSGKDSRWAIIDSLAGIGQYATALAQTDSLLQVAQASGDWRTEFMAWARRSGFLDATGQPMDSAIAPMDRRAATAPTPLHQLLRSQLAELWWQRYSRDRWRILERTELDASFDATDPETWSQGRFMERILRESNASLEPYDSLRRMPVGELGELLIGDPRSRLLRPSVFDVLAHRALALYSNSEMRLSQPAWRFTLDQTWHFDLFEPFIWKPLVHRDSTAHEFLSLRLYQQLERASINRDTLDAYVDVALQRLAYVREHSGLPEKDSLYLSALEMLRSRLPNDACEAEVMMAMARWHEEQGAQFERLGSDAWKWEKRTAHELCEASIAKWPGSFGARNAKAMIARLTQPSIALHAEQAVPSNTPFLFALTYVNASQVALRLVHVMDEDRANRNESFEAWLAEQKPLREWSTPLPDDGDLNGHLVELPVEGLPHGRHALMAINGSNFDKGSSFAWCVFQATDMAMVSRREALTETILVLDRGTGKPKAGVKAIARTNRYDSGTLRTEVVATVATDEDGTASATFSEKGGSFHWLLEAGTDRFTSGHHWHGREYDGGEVEDTRSFLFTDRAIYRPGQELFFKGIVVEGKGRVKPNYETTVFLYDANDDEVDSLMVKTDAFGAYHGKFILPMNRLTGQWYLEDEDLTGEKHFLVEEYKRPTFELTFDPITLAPKLGEEAVVTGVAKSYAGVPLDGAQVRYTVNRGARMPWWCGWAWRGLPWWRTTEIASGEAVCDAQGKFTVRFAATADRAFPRDADPVFSYSVEAWATDITGETQRAGTSLLVGYRSIDLDMSIGESLDRSTADSLTLRVANLNGERMEIPFDLRVVRLQKPEGNPKRERLWERPDRHVLTQQEFVQRFPDDAYANEDDPESWAEGIVVMERSPVDAKGWKTALAGVKDWEVGTYRITMRATDPSGKVVEANKVFTLFDPEVQNTGFDNSAFNVQVVKDRCEPGEKAILLLSTALPECRVLMEVEREGRIAVVRPFQLKRGQQRVELPVMEEDRGGFTVHFVCVERGREHMQSHRIEVPWSNKQLKVEWMSFRDKLLPGSKEEWRVKIAGPKKDRVAAQVLAAMYDASLDQFARPDWGMALWPSNYAKRGWERPEPFGVASSRTYGARVTVADSARQYPVLIADYWGGGYGRYRGERLRGGRADAAGDDAEYELQAVPGVMAGNVATFTVLDAAEKSLEEVMVLHEEEMTNPGGSAAPSSLRTDFRETAFFLPDLLTDRDGNVVWRFTMPDALTRWNLMGLAHTTDLKTAQFNKSAITQKPLMAVPNLPRYFRQGDRITLAAKINVLEGGSLTGNALLQLFDPRTNKEVNGAFGLSKAEQAFTAAPGQSALAKWTLTIPEGLDAVAVRITATAAGISDGEERVLPILTDRVLVTESLPIGINKAGTKTFELKNLLAQPTTSSTPNPQQSTLKHHSLKLEYTPNPAWYAVQALPYLMEFPHECAEQVFSRYYANRLAGSIVEKRPQVKKVFEAWSKGGAGNEQAFLSALDKNPELKGIALEETPWLLTARDEGERKRRIALFFDLHRMANEEAAGLKKLVDMQLGNGAWSWWSGMQPSRYITQHIVAGFGHLQQLDALDLDPDTDARRAIKRAIDWLDQEVEREHQRQLRNTKRDSLPDPSSEDIHYLYARSHFPQHALELEKSSAAAFIAERAQQHWLRYGLQEQAMLAMALHRMVEGSTVPALIMESLRQRATMSDELGMHWKDFHAGFAWNSFPAETHALMIEAFELVAHDKQKVNALRQYLLKLKQTTDWKTTKATADACYALLLTGDDWLEPKSAPVIRLGNEEVKAAKQEGGTGWFEKVWKPEEIKPAMGRVTVTTTNDGVQWGALHWQYFEQMDKVRRSADESPFSLKRNVMLREQTDDGPRLIEWDKARALKPGDRLTVRVELRTDRWLDFVHLKDLRASGLEPVDALSGYEWKGGLGYYRSIRDAAMHFFFDRVAPGTYVFEYELKVTHAGEFSNGITTAMCMYAPEFSSHSEGLRLKVGE